MKPVNPKGNQLEELMLKLKLKLQHFGHSLENTLMLGEIESKRRQGQKMRWFDGSIGSVNMNLSKLEESIKDGSLARCSM